MKYNILPQRDTQSFTSEDSEKEQFYPPQRRISVSIVTLLALSSTTLISVLLLLSLFTLRGRSQCSVQQDGGWNVTRPYGRENTSRMSLDHEHDDMWSVFEPIPAFGGMSKDNPDTAGMISMFHQMHCLASLRQALQLARDGEDIGHGGKDESHWPHCLDYLYQTLRCYGDDTDEWEIFTQPRTKRISGMDTMRTCRDTSQVVKRACDARAFYIRMGWLDPPLPSMCETGEMPW